MESVSETWKPCTINSDYEVSDRGRVRSLTRIVVRRNRWGQLGEFPWQGRIRKAVLHRTGYLFVNLGTPAKMYRIHQLVAWAFLGPQPTELDSINHIDGNKLNNAPANLEYVTGRENVKHAYRTGLLSNCGQTNGKAVLTDDLVRQILAFPRTVKAADVAASLGLKKHNVDQVRRGAWAHISRPQKTNP